MNEIKFIRCYTCGRHFPETEALNGHFCSQDCLSEYSQCPVCRQYYLRERGWRWGEYCSEECSRVTQKKGKIEVTL